MKKICLLISILIVFSCNSYKQHENRIILNINTKISEHKLDLSNLSLKQIPDLSNYDLLEVDLSNNKIVIFDEKLFPKKIKVINLNNNSIEGSFYIKILKLETLNLSNNKIKSFELENSIIKNLNLSNNKLERIQMPLYSSKEILADTLNISNNNKLDNYVSFFPEVYKFIIKNNIKNDKPLKFVLDKPIK